MPQYTGVHTRTLMLLFATRAIQMPSPEHPQGHNEYNTASCARGTRPCQEAMHRQKEQHQDTSSHSCAHGTWVHITCRASTQQPPTRQPAGALHTTTQHTTPSRAKGHCQPMPQQPTTPCTSNMWGLPATQHATATTCLRRLHSVQRRNSAVPADPLSL